MASVHPFNPQGIIPACLIAFDEDYSIDEYWSAGICATWQRSTAFPRSRSMAMRRRYMR